MNNDGVMDTEEYDAHVAACAEEVYYYYDGLSLAAPLEHIDTEAECKAFYDWISVDENREKSTDEGGFGLWRPVGFGLSFEGVLPSGLFIAIWLKPF